MASHSNTISGLDINSTNICYTRCVPKDKVVSNICIQPLEIDSEDYWESVNAGFDEFLKEIKIPGENIVASLCGENAIIKKIIIDSDETDIDNAIEWELSQQIVGSIDEYVFDYQRINNEPAGYFQNFLVVGYRSSSVTRITKLLRAKKLKPLIIDLDIFALINVYEINYEDRLSSPALIIYSEPSKTKVILTNNGNFIDLNIFDHSDDTQTPEGFIKILNNCIKKAFACNAEFSGADTVRIYLAGSYFYQPEITDSVIENVKNSEILYPFRKISCSAGMDDKKLLEFAPQLAVSVGLAFRDID